MEVSAVSGYSVSFHPEPGDFDCMRCGKSPTRRVTSDIRHEGPASFMTLTVACNRCGGETTREFDAFGRQTREASYKPI